MANNNKHTGPNVPALRFPEFSGEWENKCLGDISENISSGRTKSTTKEGKYVLIGSTGVIGNTSDADYSGNLILVARVGANAGLINYYSGDCGITDNTLIIKPFEQEKSFCHYVYHYLKHCNLNQFVFGSGQPLITGGMLKRLPIRYGTTDEINKVSSLFDLLDARIEAQSKIIEELTTLRSALCEKCSTQAGDIYDLSAILQEVDERSTVVNQYQVLSSTVKGIFSQKEYFNKDIASEDNKGYKVVRKGHIVLSPQNLWMGNINYNDRFDIGIVSPSYKVYSIKEGFNPIFVASLLRTKKALYEYMLASEQGASIVRRNLNVEAFMSIRFRIPEIRQQDSLSMAIASINAKINNEKSVLELLTKQKFSLLENMFI